MDNLSYLGEFIQSIVYYAPLLLVILVIINLIRGLKNFFLFLKDFIKN